MKHSHCPTILIIDNDVPTRKTLRNCLSSVDCLLLEASTGAEGLALAKSFKPTLVLVGLDMPDMGGIDLRQIHASTHSIVVAVGGASSVPVVIEALDAGADDFIPKPFYMGEFGARVRVALRHAAAMNEEDRSATFRAGELEVDFRRRTVSISGKNVHLTPLEYRVLSLLIHNGGRVLTYDRLLKAWNSRKRRHLPHIRVLMWQLRRKREPDPGKPRHLINASGVGYQLHLRGQ